MVRLLFIVFVLAGNTSTSEGQSKPEPRYVERSPDMPETRFTWNGTDGNWATAANWIPAASGTPGDGIGDTDIAIFDGTSNVDCDTSLDRSADAGTTIIITTPDFKGDIGSAANPLETNFAATGEYVLHRGSGQIFLKPVAAGAPMNLIVDAPNDGSTDNCTVQGGGDVVNVALIKSGRVNFTSSCGFTTTRWVMTTGPQARAHLSSISFAPSIINVAGEIIVDGDMGTLAADRIWIVTLGGKTTITGLIDDNNTVLVGGGILEYTPTADASADNPDILAVGGILDLSKNTQDIDPTNLVIGLFGDVLGNIADTGLSVTSIKTDLRDDFPKVE
jgi:hypothetical protein